MPAGSRSVATLRDVAVAFHEQKLNQMAKMHHPSLSGSPPACFCKVWKARSASAFPRPNKTASSGVFLLIEDRWSSCIRIGCYNYCHLGATITVIRALQWVSWHGLIFGEKLCFCLGRNACRHGSSPQGEAPELATGGHAKDYFCRCHFGP